MENTRKFENILNVYFLNLQLPSEKIVALVIPLDNCYQSLKTATLESIGYVMLDYSICTSKP